MKKIFALFLCGIALSSVCIALAQLNGINQDIKFNDLKNSRNTRVVGILMGTLNKEEWRGVSNAVYNEDHSVTLMAQEQRVYPKEQIEVTFNLKGPGTYALKKGQALFFKLDSTNAIVSHSQSSGAKGDRIIITAYDEKEHLLQGSLHFSAKGTAGSVTFSTELFYVRLK